MATYDPNAGGEETDSTPYDNYEFGDDPGRNQVPIPDGLHPAVLLYSMPEKKDKKGADSWRLKFGLTVRAQGYQPMLGTWWVTVSASQGRRWGNMLKTFAEARGLRLEPGANVQPQQFQGIQLAIETEHGKDDFAHRIFVKRFVTLQEAGMGGPPQQGQQQRRAPAQRQSYSHPGNQQGQQPQHAGGPPPGYGQPQPGYGQGPPPGYGQPQPGYGQGPPQGYPQHAPQPGYAPAPGAPPPQRSYGPPNPQQGGPPQGYAPQSQGRSYGQQPQQGPGPMQQGMGLNDEDIPF